MDARNHQTTGPLSESELVNAALFCLRTILVGSWTECYGRAALKQEVYLLLGASDRSSCKARATDVGSGSIPTRTGGLHAGGLLPQATDFGDRSVPTRSGGLH